MDDLETLKRNQKILSDRYAFLQTQTKDQKQIGDAKQKMIEAGAAYQRANEENARKKKLQPNTGSFMDLLGGGR